MKPLRLMMSPMRAVAAIAAITAIALMARGLGAAGSSSITDESRGWPRTTLAGNDTLLMYQPQLETWENNLLMGRAAVAVTRAGDSQTTYGVIWFSAHTEVEKDSRVVDLTDLAIIRGNFPSSDDGGAVYLAALRDDMKQIHSASLDRIEANLAITRAKTTQRKVDVKNDPPRIIFETSPAVLVLIDGDPVVRPVEGSKLTRVINTKALILTEDGKTWFMQVGDQWVRSSSIQGPFVFADKVPSDVKAVAAQGVTTDDASPAGLDDDLKSLLAQKKAPTVVVSSTPAEIIQSAGPLQFAPITGTELLYADNTPGDVFVDVTSQTRYVLVSGRWFKGPDLSGPWTFVPPDQMPAEFYKIPEDHPKGSVLAQLAGTDQATEAAIANEIPQTAAVHRADATFEPQYDGSAKFIPIEGTSMAYGENTSEPVIRINAYLYYAVSNGVWFSSHDPNGPWVVATEIPSEIYSIPPSCPVYYATYVRVYGYTPSIVYVGYTPGYFGTCLSPWGTVVYGPGYYYRPWIGRYWYGCPATYGYGAAFSWSSMSGWAFGFGFGCTPIYRPWWGPVGYAWGWGGPYRPYYCASHYNVYHHWGGSVYGRPRPWYGYVPPQGGRYPVPPPQGRGQPNSGHQTAGSVAPRPGQYPSGLTRPIAGGGGVQQRPTSGGGVQQRPTAGGGVQPNPTSGGGGVVANPNTRQTPGGVYQPGTRPNNRPGDVYAGSDGNVYRRENSGWQRYDRGQWQGLGSSTRSVPSQNGANTRPTLSQSGGSKWPIQWHGDGSMRPTPSQPGGGMNGRPAPDTPQQLERGRTARNQGDARAQSWQNSRQRYGGSFNSGPMRASVPAQRPQGASRPTQQPAQGARHR